VTIYKIKNQANVQVENGSMDYKKNYQAHNYFFTADRA
jgi:hypothetical protein